MKKKLILVGNKLTYRSGLHAIIDSFDYVLRISRMNNLDDTGKRIGEIDFITSFLYWHPDDRWSYLSDKKRFYL